MPFDENINDFTPRSYEPDPAVLFVNNCIQLKPENCFPGREDEAIHLILEETSLPEDYNFMGDAVMTTVKASIAKTLLNATSIQFKGRFYKAIKAK